MALGERGRPGALLLLAVDYPDRGVQIDRQRRVTRTSAQARAKVRDSTASSWRT